MEVFFYGCNLENECVMGFMMLVISYLFCKLFRILFNSLLFYCCFYLESIKIGLYLFYHLVIT